MQLDLLNSKMEQLMFHLHYPNQLIAILNAAVVGEEGGTYFIWK